MANVSQQPCISFKIPAVQLPPLFAPSFGASLSFPPPPNIPNGIPCCKFKVPSFTLPLQLPPVPIGTVIAILNAAIATAMGALPNVQIPSCNL